jgi:hypothetical protein
MTCRQIVFGILGLIAIGFAMSALFIPTRAQCGWCPSYKCFGPCGGECLCMSRDYSGGVCVDVEARPDLEKLGYVVLD